MSPIYQVLDGMARMLVVSGIRLTPADTDADRTCAATVFNLPGGETVSLTLKLVSPAPAVFAR